MYQPGYQLLVFTVSFVIPLSGIFYCYYRMFREGERQRGMPAARQISHISITGKTSLDTKVIKTIAIVVMMFVLCWMPLFVVDLYNSFCDNCVRNHYLLTSINVMHYSSSVLNPIIYVWYNKQYRQAFVSVLTKFAHAHGAEFVVVFLNNNNTFNIGGGNRGNKTQKVVLMRS